MSRTLVLIRHGKALVGTDGQPDERRALTRAGARALAAQFPLSLSMLGKNGSDKDGTEVWSSPAQRARQTAEVAARVLECPNVRIVPCLWEQDGGAFLDELASSSAPRIVAVGHNPFMERVARLLCGVDLPFSTGAVAALELPGTSAEPLGDGSGRQVDARLLWFVQGPRAKRWETLCALEEAMSRAAENVDARMGAFLREPDDPETLHKLRVSIRAARSLSAFFAPYQKASQSKALRNDLRDVVLQTSDLRELDVLAAQVRGLEKPAEDLLSALGTARAAERDRLLAALSSPPLRQAFGRAVENARSIRWRDPVEREGLSRKRLRERFAAMEGRLAAGLVSVDLQDHDATHRLRKLVKRVRYVAEGIPDLLGESSQRASREAKVIQNRLGALCDARANISIARDFPAEGLSGGARRNLEELVRSSEELVFAGLSQPAAQ